jgi:hypothetical protein
MRLSHSSGVRPIGSVMLRAIVIVTPFRAGCAYQASHLGHLGAARISAKGPSPFASAAHPPSTAPRTTVAGRPTGSVDDDPEQARPR